MPTNFEERLNKFRRLELPGQPPSMHMGTAYLVEDLWKEIVALRAELAKTKSASPS